MIFVGKQNCKVRACVVTDKDVNAWILNQFSNEDICTIGIKDSNNINIFVSAYLPYDSPHPPPCNLLKDLTDYCGVKGWGLTIGADANSHNLIWGSSNNNPRGEQLMDWILSNNVHIVNKGNKPTFSNIVREEIIDLTLCDTNSVDRIENWHVSDENTLSDHNHIEFDFIIAQAEDSSETYRNVKKTNWTNFRD
jgi:hypothetical protein